MAGEEPEPCVAGGAILHDPRALGRGKEERAPAQRPRPRHSPRAAFAPVNYLLLPVPRALRTGRVPTAARRVPTAPEPPAASQ